MAVVSMSKQEFSRLDVLLRVQLGRLRVSDACVLIRLQRRQVFRLLRGLKQGGATSLLSKHRGKPSNHRLPAEVRTLAVSCSRRPVPTAFSVVISTIFFLNSGGVIVAPSGQADRLALPGL